MRLDHGQHARDGGLEMRLDHPSCSLPIARRQRIEDFFVLPPDELAFIFGLKHFAHSTPQVVIGHNVRILPSTIEQDAIIGMGAIIGEGTVVRAGVAAGSITEPGTEVGAGQVWSGRPARAARPLSDRNRKEFARAVKVYVEYAGNYLACGTEGRRSAGSR